MKITRISTHQVEVPLKPARRMISALGQHTVSRYVLVRVETDAGVKELLLRVTNGRVHEVRVDMGQPDLKSPGGAFVGFCKKRHVVAPGFDRVKPPSV